MPSLGAFELLVIAIVAIIVVGPKDLPKLLRWAGQAFRQVRGLAQDFHDSMDDLARESELDELRKQVETMRQQNMLSDAKGAVSEVVNPLTGQSMDITGGAAKSAAAKPASGAVSPDSVSPATLSPAAVAEDKPTAAAPAATSEPAREPVKTGEAAS